MPRSHGGEALVCSLDHVEHDELAVFVQNGADSAVDDLVLADLVGQCGGSVIGCENVVFGAFAFACMAAALYFAIR